VFRRQILIAALLCFPTAHAGAEDLEGPTKDKFNSGVAAFDAGRYEDAFKIFSAIDDQNIAAMRNVALMERCGLGTAKDPKAAREEYEQAARAGMPTAQADLGEMLMLGEGGKADPEQAAEWLALAVAAHHPIAEYELATLYETGQGVEKNPDLAHDLYLMASKHDVPGAKERLAGQTPPPLPGECDTLLAKAKHVP
jgi:TPR repeat protein